jgi:hypothetical protein
MDEPFLKGNFKTKRTIAVENGESKGSIQHELRKKALGTLGGSMVYMERNNLTWDGED